MDAAPSPSTSGLFAEVLQAFQVDGDVLRVEPWGAGHIHDTWRVTSADGTSSRRTIVQRFNASVFPDPRGVSASILRVTRHLRARLRERGAGDLERRVLRVLTTRAGEGCLRRDDGSWWRGFPFVEGAVSHDVAPSSAAPRF